MSLREFKDLLPMICNGDTSQDPGGWTKNNPLWGHCAVVSLLAQDVFGGELLRASLEGTEFAKMRSHYWNKLPTFGEVDFTGPQFGDNYPEYLRSTVRERDYLLSNPETKRRYRLLAERFKKLKPA
ncbi:MAG: hypothetical protein HYT03_03315 [Candidatus Harrisonbacteria bacterium]|nr:hypothetical protein [Candidatus Harrisonbacteria bacterium]